MILLDTDVLIDVLRRHPAAVEWVRSVVGQELVVPGYVVMELIRGCRTRRDLNALLAYLRPFRVVWPGRAAQEAAVQTMIDLCLSNGISVVDVLVAHCAIALKAPLYTFNRKHFEVVAGLQTIQPYTR